MDSVDHLIDISARAENARPSKGSTNGAPYSMNSPCKASTTLLSQSTYSILVGQVLSVLIASTGAATTLLNQYTGNSVMPAAQNCPNYVIMSLFLLYSPTRTYFGCSGSRNVSQESIESVYEATAALAPDSPNSMGKTPDGTRSSALPSEVLNDVWWRYALLACVDVEANVVAVWAYKYTSITSAMLLDCATIPFVMLLSWLVLGAHYTWQHFAGALLCFCGVLTIMLSDMLDGSTSTNGAKRAFGLEDAR
jgi:drug/metabolite transporter (DMT)-like permease